MVKSDFKTYTDYFKDFVASDPDLAFFMFGSVQRGMDIAVGHRDFKFPFLWLEEPKVLSSDNGGQYWDEFIGGVSFITQCQGDSTIDEEIAALDLAFRIMARFEKKYREDYQKDFFLEISPQKEKGIIDPHWLQSAVGWRMEFQFKLNSNFDLHDN